MFKELLADGDRVLVIANADEERVVRLAEPLRERHPPRRRLAAARHPRRLRLREGAEVGGRGARPRGGPRHRLRSNRRPLWADRAHPRRRRAALPVPGAVPRARAQAPQGRAPLRPSGLRQDPHRQGRRELAGQEGRHAKRPARRSSPTSSTSRAPSCSTSTSARPSGTSGWSSSGPVRRRVERHAGHRVLRRDGLPVPHPRLRGLLRRREHDRPAAAQRDRRRRAARERPRHRRLQPRGHDRPRDPAARTARREDQDRAPRRRVRPRHLQQVPHCDLPLHADDLGSSAATATPAWRR